MTTILAEFDGKVFIPCEDVKLPAGTRVGVVVPEASATPAAVSTEELTDAWKRILRDLESSEPYFPTLEDALKYSRKRP